MDETVPTTHCSTCGRPFGKRQRCYYCNGRPRTGETRACLVCGASFYAQPNEVGRFCSTACKKLSQVGIEKVTGTSYVRKDGYVAVKVGIRKYELEHRLVVAQVIGRQLSTDEQVHHINGDRSDNRPENLLLLTNAEHQRLHDHLGVQHAPRMVSLICKVCGAHYSKPAGRAAGSSCCSRSCQMANARAARASKKKPQP